MREIRPYGSARGVRRNPYPYRDTILPVRSTVLVPARNRMQDHSSDTSTEFCFASRPIRLPVSTSNNIGGPLRNIGAPALSFLRHEQIYRSDVSVVPHGRRDNALPRLHPHRLDESAAGYSLVSCSPAELTSASPTGCILYRSAETVNDSCLHLASEGVCGSVSSDVVGNASRPHFPKDTDPGASEYAHSVWMSATTSSGSRVNMRRPRGTAARVICQEREGNAQPMIASPAKGHAARFAALLGHWSNTCLSGKLVGSSQALTNVSNLGKDFRGGKVACIRQAHDQHSILKLCDFSFDARGNGGDLLQQRSYNARQHEHKFPLGLLFQLADPTHGSCTQASQKLGGRVAATVSLPFEERSEAFFSKTRSTAGRGESLKKSQCDRGADLVEQRSGARPEAVEQGLQLIRQCDAVSDQIIARAHKRPECLDSVRRRCQWPEAMTVGAQHISQQIGIAQVVLTTRGTITRPARFDRIWMDRHNLVTVGQQSIDNQPRWSFDSDGNRTGRSDFIKLLLKRLQAARIMVNLGLQYNLSCLVHDTYGVGSAAPIQSGKKLHNAPRLHENFRVGRSGRLLTNWHSWAVSHGASSCGLLRLPGTCHAAGLIVAIQRPVSKAIMAGARMRETAPSYRAASQ